MIFDIIIEFRWDRCLYLMESHVDSRLIGDIITELTTQIEMEWIEKEYLSNINMIWLIIMNIEQMILNGTELKWNHDIDSNTISLSSYNDCNKMRIICLWSLYSPFSWII